MANIKNIKKHDECADYIKIENQCVIDNEEFPVFYKKSDDIGVTDKKISSEINEKFKKNKYNRKFLYAIG